MLVKVYVEKNKEFYTYKDKEDYFSELECKLVDVPLFEIAKVLAKRYNLDYNNLYDLLLTYDLDTYFEGDDDITDLALKYM